MKQHYAAILQQLPVCLMYKLSGAARFSVSQEFIRQFALSEHDSIDDYAYFDVVTGAPFARSPLLVAEEAGELCQRVSIHTRQKRYRCLLHSRHLQDDSGQAYLVIHISIEDIHDIGQRPVNRSLASHLAFSMLLSSISTQLINARHDKVDSLIEKSLGSFGQFFNADRCYLFRFSADKRSMDNTHEWVAANVRPYKDELQQMPMSALPYFDAVIKANRVFQVNDVQHMPSQAHLEQREFTREGIRAMLCVAVYLNDDLFGFIGCDILTGPHRWQHYEIRYLKLIGEMVSETLLNVNNRRSLLLLQKELIQANQALEKQVNLDGLTGIANRRRFDETLTREWTNAEQQNRLVSLIIIDVDFFKLYNDSYGHLSGDTALRKIARAIDTEARLHEGLAARYGGEEFAVILAGHSEQACRGLAKQLLRTIDRLAIPFDTSSIAPTVTVSLGCASAHLPAQDSIRSLIKRADDALYHAKSSGRNQASYASTEACCTV